MGNFKHAATDFISNLQLLKSRSSIKENDNINKNLQNAFYKMIRAMDEEFDQEDNEFYELITKLEK